MAAKKTSDKPIVRTFYRNFYKNVQVNKHKVRLKNYTRVKEIRAKCEA